MTRSSRLIALGGLSAATLLTGCLDSIVREMGPENHPTVTNTASVFSFKADDMENVNDELVFTWNNSAPQAAFHHDSFIHHGYGIVIITDAAGVQVDSTLLELNLESETEVGTPGNWTIELILAGARGRVDFALTPKP
jgi:hypothetical protein